MEVSDVDNLINEEDETSSASWLVQEWETPFNSSCAQSQPMEYFGTTSETFSPDQPLAGPRPVRDLGVGLLAVALVTDSLVAARPWVGHPPAALLVVAPRDRGT